MVPKSILYLTGASMLVCLPMFALSIVNFGMLSIWLNATVAFLILIHHISFMAVAWVTRKKDTPKDIASEDDDDSLHLAPEPSIAIHMANLAFLSFLTIINIIAFSIMVDITTRGGINSTLPIERIGHKWNIKIQIGQTAVLGVELVLLGAILLISGLGRRRFAIEQEERDEEVEYNLA
ncbi:hypothetical protein GALMADRAFT_61472 [Galerina marginata CBS 339.88]|uniref:Uncharacterized protein n=1 Tax=Galerina marginata (strain CBS 339.88) TaxID=685588 RepID=A0A067TFC0_GALM3|nr:hypothetical protein GALMADRAFT_61472 [Galerina marginata CBS 339.88]